MSLAYKSNCHQTENGYRLDKCGWTYQSCECCPYGYHIDLDFVRYCESINKQEARTGTMNKRRERRRQRQSMEVLLGLANPPNIWSSEQILPQIPQEPCSPRLHSNDTRLQSALVEDALGDVVSDFERTLERSNNMSVQNNNNINNSYDTPDILHRVPSNSSVSSGSGSGCHEAANISNGNIGGDFDAISVESASGLSAAALRNIREQMALGLERMKELEEKVKIIPTLQVQLSVLKEEKRKLLELIRKQNLYVTETEITNTHRKTAVPPQRDIGVMCSVITRHIGVGPQYPKTRTIATDTQETNLTDQQFKKSSSLVSQSSQTKIHNSEVAIQTVNFVKHVVTLGINVKPETKDSAIQIQKESRSIGVSDDTTKDSICLKCNILKRSIGVGPTSYIDNHLPVSLKSLSAPRSKSFNLGEERLNFNMKHRTIGCQSEIYSMNKACQYESKVTSRYSQSEHKPLSNKSVQYESCNVTQMTDTSDLLSKMDVSCGTVNLLKLDVSCNTVEVPNENSKCAKCSGETAKKEEVSGIASRIPRPSYIPTTPVENRKFRRQDTYTKIPAVSPSSLGLGLDNCLSGLDLSPTTVSKIDLVNSEKKSFSSKVKQNYLPDVGLSETQSASTNGVALLESKPTSGEPSITISEPIIYVAINKFSRDKVYPSKEMQAAMKVLNDSLQKSKNSNVRNQVQSALDIIQQEWFKVSSTVSANPLNVEDYLDCFEEISSALLQFVVNMTDDSGNTAMHYAVSHANFDVVSILLDSKVCNINKVNKAGYTSVMLVSLTEMRTPTHSTVVKRLFQLADVNIRAKQHGQTALMLAVSHGRLDMVQMLLEAGADINIQDEDGSTSLMCAAEHGHIEIVKYFLNQPDCDSSIVDIDGSTALKIALEAGHKDIGVLLYAHEHSVHRTSPFPSLRHRKSKNSSSKSTVTPLPGSSNRSSVDNKSLK